MVKRLVVAGLLLSNVAQAQSTVSGTIYPHWEQSGTWVGQPVHSAGRPVQLRVYGYERYVANDGCVYCGFGLRDFYNVTADSAGNYSSWIDTSTYSCTYYHPTNHACPAGTVNHLKI